MSKGVDVDAGDMYESVEVAKLQAQRKMMEAMAVLANRVQDAEHQDEAARWAEALKATGNAYSATLGVTVR